MHTCRSFMSDAPQGTFVVIPEISHSDISYIIKKKNPRHSVQSAGGNRYETCCRCALVDQTLRQYFVHEFDDAVRDVVFDLRIVVDLMTEAGIKLGRYIFMPGLSQPVGYLINSLAVHADRVLIAGDVVDRKLRRHLGGPFLSFDPSLGFSTIFFGSSKKR